MKKLYKFYWDCGRQGDVKGMFIADEQEVKDSIGQNIYFGEILGKHSEVYGTIDEGDITEVKVSEQTVKEMEEVLGYSISGYNPLNYIQYTCSKCGASYNVGEVDWYLDEEGNKICEYCIDSTDKSTLTKIE